MSNEVNDQDDSVNDMDLETKIKHDKGNNPDDYQDNDQPVNAEMLALEKKKNELLNEKKKVQQQNREMQEELDRMKNALKVQETEKLEEKQEYKLLYEQTLQAKTDVEDRLFSVQNNLVKDKKIKAFDKELGSSLNNDKYYNFVDLDSIIVEADGSLNPDSVRYATNMFRSSHKELVPKAKFPTVGSQSASNQGIAPTSTRTTTSTDRSNAKRALLTK